MSFLAILEVLNFDLVNLSNFQVPNLPKIQNSEYLKLPNMTFFDRIHQNLILRKFEWQYNYQISTKSSLSFTF